MRLHSRELGQGRPFVLLHGLFGSSDNWMGVAPKFAQHFRVFLVDLRNHGLSPHSDEMTWAAMAGDLAEFFDAHGIERANLLGHSLGGKVAMQFALSFPVRVGKLVVVDMAPRANPPEHDRIFEALLALDLQRYHSRREMEEVLAPSIPDLTLRRFLLKNLKSFAPPTHGKGGNDGGSRSFDWKINLRGLFHNYPRLLEAVRIEEPYPKPVLFLRGGKSHYVLDSDAPLIHRFFPQAKIETIARANHWVHADAPEEFVARVLEFLVQESLADNP